MDSNLFWFSDEQWAKIVPHLPTNQLGTHASHQIAMAVPT